MSPFPRQEKIEMKTSLRRVLLSAAALCLVTSANAWATQHTVRVSLDSFQEVPASGTGATGMGVVQYDDVTGAVNISGTYTGLAGAQTLAHLHGLAPAGMNAGILITLSGTG